MVGADVMAGGGQAVPKKTYQVLRPSLSAAGRDAHSTPMVSSSSLLLLSSLELSDIHVYEP